MSTPTPTVEAVAEAYQVSRQRLHQLRRAFALELADFARPELVFDRLIEAGRACPLRSRLADPVERAVIQDQLASNS